VSARRKTKILPKEKINLEKIPKRDEKFKKLPEKEFTDKPNNPRLGPVMPPHTIPIKINQVPASVLKIKREVTKPLPKKFVRTGGFM